MADASDRNFSDDAAASREKTSGDGERSLKVTSTQSTASWLKDSILGLPKKLFSSLISSPELEETETGGEFPPESITATELKVVGEDKWIVVESSSASSLSSAEEENMSTSASSESRSRNHLQPEAGQVNGGTPGSQRKRLPTGGSKSASSTPQLGSRANSISKGQKMTRPGSPHSQPSSATHSPVQRKISGKNTRPVNLEVQNGGGGGGSSGAIGSPSSSSSSSGRIRSSSPPRGASGKSSSTALRSSSPTSRASPTQGVRGESKSGASQQRSASPSRVRSSSPTPRASKNGKASSHSSSHSSSPSAARSSSPVRSSSGKTDAKGDSKLASGVKADGKPDSGKPPSGKSTSDLKKSNHRTGSPSLNAHGVSNGINSGGGSFRKKKGILVNSSTDVTAASSSSSQSSSTSGVTNGRIPQVSSVNSSHSGNSRTHPVPTISLPKENGTAGASGASSSDKGGSGDGSAFEKVRDTLRISRPKKKKGKKLAYSIVVDPALSTPEINLHSTGKYEDPFETSFAENGEPEKKLDHDFKPASIPHNKPEYCDHCGDMAWGLYRQVLKCSRCNFVAHRKCEFKVQMACSTRMEQAILQHDKQVEDVERIAAVEQVDDSSKESDRNPTPSQPTPPPPTDTPTPSSSNTATSSSASATPSSVTTSTSASSSSTPNPISSQLMAEKTKLSRKIREYNRKTTPVHHIHIKSTHQVVDPSNIEYHGFVRVHMSVQRPIHVSTAITRTSWYRLMRPVKERTLNDVDGYDIQTAFYLPLDTNRLVHIQNSTTTKELIQILLKKFCVTDNPKKFSLYEDYGSDCRRLFEEDRPLEISLDASVSHRNSKLVLRDNTYSTIQWDAFSAPELGNFIQILQREEELYVAKMEERFSMWRKVIQQALKDKCMEEQAKKTKKSVSSRLSKSKLSPKPGRKASATKTPSPKTVGRKSGK